MDVGLSRYTLKNSSGMTVQVIEFGAAITSILVPDKHGNFDDVTAGFDTLCGLYIMYNAGCATLRTQSQRVNINSNMLT